MDVVRWWSDGGQMVVRWWSDGGQMVVRWWSLHNEHVLKHRLNQHFLISLISGGN
jgi:hypothetical protein